MLLIGHLIRLREAATHLVPVLLSLLLGGCGSKPSCDDEHVQTPILCQTDGEPVRLAEVGEFDFSDRQAPLALDETHLYIHHVGKGLVRVKKSGGAPELVRASICPIRGIAVTSTAVYWLEGCSNGSILQTMDKTTETITTVDDFPYASAYGLIATEQFLVWATEDDSHIDRAWFWNLETGESSPLAFSSLYQIDAGIHQGFVYWGTRTDDGDGTLVFRASGLSPDVELFAQGDDEFDFLFASDLGVFVFTHDGEPGLLRLVDGTLVPAGEGGLFATGAASDQVAVVAGNGSVTSYRAPDFEGTLIARGIGGIAGVATDNEHAYVLSMDERAVYRVPLGL